MNSSNKIIYLGLILLILAAVNCDQQFDRYFRSTRKKFCGRMLVETLAIVCDKGYYGIPQKRTGNFKNIFFLNGFFNFIFI